MLIAEVEEKLDKTAENISIMVAYLHVMIPYIF